RLAVRGAEEFLDRRRARLPGGGRERGADFEALLEFLEEGQPVDRLFQDQRGALRDGRGRGQVLQRGHEGGVEGEVGLGERRGGPGEGRQRVAFRQDENVERERRRERRRDRVGQPALGEGQQVEVGILKGHDGPSAQGTGRSPVLMASRAVFQVTSTSNWAWKDLRSLISQTAVTVPATRMSPCKWTALSWRASPCCLTLTRMRPSPVSLKPSRPSRSLARPSMPRTKPGRNLLPKNWM